MRRSRLPSASGSRGVEGEGGAQVEGRMSVRFVGSRMALRQDIERSEETPQAEGEERRHDRGLVAFIIAVDAACIGVVVALWLWARFM